MSETTVMFDFIFLLLQMIFFFLKSGKLVHLRAKLYKVTCEAVTDNTEVHDCHMISSRMISVWFARSISTSSHEL